MPAPLHILILENNPADAVLMVRALRQRGVDCTWQRVETRAEYLAQLGPQYEVILADYNLPEFTAPQELELLHERGWDIPFIVVTGIVDEEAVVACMKEGAADYLLKDRLARLAPAITSALEQKRLRDEKRQTEAALRASEQRFRALIENSSDAVALIAADGTLLYVSPSGSRMFGRSWGERLGRNVFDLMHPDDLPAIKDRFVHLLRAPDTTVTAQFRYQHQDDSWRWVEAVGQNLLAELSVQAVVVNYRDITEHKEAEKALRESEERYRSLFENALEGIFRSTPTGRFTHINPALVRMLGYDSAAEVLSLQIPEDLYIDPVQREQLQLSHDPLGKVEGVELRWKKKNGEPMGVMLYAKADRDAQGTISAYEGMVLDITERKRAEDALRVREGQLRRLFEANIVGIFFANINSGAITEANTAFLRMTGYTYEDLQAGKLRWDAMTPPVYRPLDERIAKELFTIGICTSYEKEYIRKDGSHIPVVLGAALLERSQDTCIVFALDITDRKRAEAAVQAEAHSAAALAQVGQALIATLDTPIILRRLCELTTAVLGCDFSTTLLWQPENDTYTVMANHGHSPEEWETLRVLKLPRTGLTFLLSQFEQSEVVPVNLVAMRHLPLAALANQQYGITWALYTPLRQGQEIIGIQAACYRGQHEPFTTQQQRILRGIAHLASLALANARLLEELRQANYLKDEFLATMSHELRTPLHIVMGYADLLLDGKEGPLTSRQGNLVQRMQKAAHQEFELITAMLDVSRLTAGQLPVKVQKVQLPALLNELATEVQEWLREKPAVTYTWQLAPQLSIVHTDQLKLKVILKNLLNNAMKFTEQGSIGLAVRSLQDGVEFRVTDTGSGIPPEVQAVMFERFRQGESAMTRHYDGVGLGLYIVKRMLELLEGTVTVESAVGKGSTFSIWIPQEGQKTLAQRSARRKDHQNMP